MRIVRRYDLAVILALIVIAVAMLLLLGGEGKTAIIEVNGEVYATIDLSDDDRIIEIDGVVLELKDHKISFVSSPCPDKLCCRFGTLSQAGQAAACVPMRISVRISGKPRIDAITG